MIAATYDLLVRARDQPLESFITSLRTLGPSVWTLAQTLRALGQTVRRSVQSVRTLGQTLLEHQDKPLEALSKPLAIS